MGDATQVAPGDRSVRVFAAVYTKDKRRKRKRWREGAIKVSVARKKLVLFDAEEAASPQVACQGTPLDALFVNDVRQLETEYDFDHFLVEVGLELHDHTPPTGVDATVADAGDGARRPLALVNSSARGSRPANALPNRSRSGCENLPRGHAIAASNAEQSKSEPVRCSPPARPATGPPRRTNPHFMKPGPVAATASTGPSTSPLLKPQPAPMARERQARTESTPGHPLSTDDLLGIFSLGPTETSDLHEDARDPIDERQPKLHASEEAPPLEPETRADYELGERQTNSGAAVSRFKRPAATGAPTCARFAAHSHAPAPRAGACGGLAPVGSLRMFDASLGPNRTVQRSPPGRETAAEYEAVFKRQLEKAVTEEVQVVINAATDPAAGRGRRALAWDDSATLFRSTGRGDRAGKPSKRKTRRKPGRLLQLSDDEEVEAPTAEPCSASSGARAERLFLACPKLASNAAARKACRMGDLWFVDPVQVARRDGRGGELSDFARCWVLKSLWHGMSADGVVEVEAVSSNFRPSAVSSSWSRKTRVSASRGPNAEHELAMAATATSLTLDSPPVARSLMFKPDDPRARRLNARPLPGPADASERACMLEAVAEEFGLNADQRVVLTRVGSWFEADAAQHDPVVLVHGPYGSGKTKLTCASIVLLSRLLDAAPPGAGADMVRICVSSATNVAVDNVLRGLLEAGMSEFGRVGSLKRVARDLLGHVIHFDPRGFQHAVQDAKAQLRTIGEPSAKEALERLESRPLTQIEREQAAFEATCRVVGVTCCSAASKGQVERMFAGRRAVCFVDEASQAVEALSLMPLAKSRCEFAVLVGDPLQLPPVTVSRPRAAPVYADYATPLFERLQGLGRQPVLLSTQYRCHPSISALASGLFYGGRVSSGVAAAERAALVPGLPPLTLFDVFHGQERQVGSSIVNHAEQAMVVQLVRALLKYGLEPGDVCAIALFRAQAEAIRAALAESGDPNDRAVTASTTDAFQGAERKVVIISTCRTAFGAGGPVAVRESGGGGFTECPRRLNVMLTRARHHVIIFGHAGTLQDSPLWRDIVAGCNSALSLDGLLGSLRATSGA